MAWEGENLDQLRKLIEFRREYSRSKDFLVIDFCIIFYLKGSIKIFSTNSRKVNITEGNFDFLLLKIEPLNNVIGYQLGNSTKFKGKTNEISLYEFVLP